MVYALTLTIAVGLLILLVVAVATLFVRRAAGREWPSIGRWRFHPSPLGLLLLLPLAGLLLWRIIPALLFIPFVFPFFLRGRRVLTPFFIMRQQQRRQRGASPNGRAAEEEDSTIEGQYRPLDEE